MAISTSKYRIGREKRSIADELASQTQGLKEKPWWETVGAVALPLLATAAMGPLGGYLTTLGAGGGALGTLAGALGTGLSSAGAVGSGAGGILKTLGSTGIKALYNIGTKELQDELFKGLDKRGAKDIKVTGSALRKALGKSAQSKLREDYNLGQRQMGQTGLTGALMSAVASQGSGAFKDMFKGLFKGKGSSMLEGLSGAVVDEAQQIAKTAEIMGEQASPLQQIMSGQKMITDPNALVPPSSLDKINLFTKQSMPVDFGTDLIQDASLRQGTIANNLLAQQNLQDVSKATELFPDINLQGGMNFSTPFLPGQGSAPSNLTPEAIQQLLSSYYGYEDIPKGWR